MNGLFLQAQKLYTHHRRRHNHWRKWSMIASDVLEADKADVPCYLWDDEKEVTIIKIIIASFFEESSNVLMAMEYIFADLSQSEENFYCLFCFFFN